MTQLEDEIKRQQRIIELDEQIETMWKADAIKSTVKYMTPKFSSHG